MYTCSVCGGIASDDIYMLNMLLKESGAYPCECPEDVEDDDYIPWPIDRVVLEQGLK